jgi:hypothetical protein
LTEDEISQQWINFLESGYILWTVDEISRKWMKTAVSFEADENISMSDRVARRSDQGGPRYPLGEQGRRIPGRVPNGGWTGPTEADRCPMESGSGPTEGGMDARQRARWVPDGGRVSGGGPTVGLESGLTGDYISIVGPHFWALSSSAQSHLQEMRVRRVLMNESVI